MKLGRRAFLATGAALGQSLAPVADDWQGVDRIVAVGDIHGDKDAFVAVLRMAGLIDDQERWIGGKAHLVQVGDIPARGPQVRRSYDLLMKLELEAERAGGRVHPLIGNHDAGVIYGDLRGVLPEEYGEFRQPDSEWRIEKAYAEEVESRKSAGRYPASAGEQEYLRKHWYLTHPPGFVEHREAFQPSGPYGSWIGRNNSLIRINDTLFVHGGISPKYLRHSRGQINATIRRELANPTQMLPGMATDPQGPLWYRGLAESEGAASVSHVQALTRTHGVRRIVIGHRVTRTAIMPGYSARVINVDLGLSRFYGRPPACLVIEGANLSVLHRNVKVPVPGPGIKPLRDYLSAIEAADEKPSPVTPLLSGDVKA